MMQQIGRILVHPVGAGPLELLEAMAAREQPDPEGPRTTGREQVPDAVAHDHRGADLDIEAAGPGQEEVGVGLGALDPRRG